MYHKREVVDGRGRGEAGCTWVDARGWRINGKIGYPPLVKFIGLSGAAPWGAFVLGVSFQRGNVQDFLFCCLFVCFFLCLFLDCFVLSCSCSSFHFPPHSLALIFS